MATTNTEVGVDPGAKTPFPPFQTETYPSQLLWLALTFGLFYYLMAKVALPRIASILEVRSDRIAQDIDEANRLKDESDAAISAYEHDLAEARSRAHTIAQEARDKAKAEADANRETVEADLAEKLAVAEKSIAATRDAAMTEVSTIAESSAEEIIKQLLGGKVTKAEIVAAVASAKG
ncbi:MAG: F0F1 ATP synthase subunit B [Pseudomonadota bacterium]